MICLYRQERHGAHFCLASEKAKHCGAIRALVCSAKNALGSRLAALGMKLRGVVAR